MLERNAASWTLPQAAWPERLAGVADAQDCIAIALGFGREAALVQIALCFNAERDKRLAALLADRISSDRLAGFQEECERLLGPVRDGRAFVWMPAVCRFDGCTRGASPSAFR